jgi:hypothetical protein
MFALLVGGSSRQRWPMGRPCVAAYAGSHGSRKCLQAHQSINHSQPNNKRTRSSRQCQRAQTAACSTGRRS